MTVSKTKFMRSCRAMMRGIDVNLYAYVCMREYVCMYDCIQIKFMRSFTVMMRGIDVNLYAYVCMREYVCMHVCMQSRDRSEGYEVIRM
jgi:hypothetical protein